MCSQSGIPFAGNGLSTTPLLPEGATLSRGHHVTSLPGPSVVPDRVLQAMHVAMPNIYEGSLIDLSDSIIEELPRITMTTGRAFIAISNGHGVWEMALTNTLSKGDHVLVLESGPFALGWAAQAQFLGVHIEVLHAPDRRAIDLAAVEERLRADTHHRIRAILAVQVDTMSSCWNDIAALRGAVDRARHPALLMVDCVGSLGCVEYRMDDWGVDVTVAASQKGLMVPPGLGFVWASSRALEAHKTAGLRTPYWDWTSRMNESVHYLRYCGTPPINHLHGLRAALDMLSEEGLPAVWARHAVLAHAVRSAIAAWSAPAGMEFNILHPGERSNAVTTVRTGRIDAQALRTMAENVAGVSLGIGLQGLERSSFRVGHMGHMNVPHVLGTLGAIEAALVALGAPMSSSGVAAAAAAVAPALRAAASPPPGGPRAPRS